MAVDLVSPIASQGKACVHRFEQLCALFEDEKRQSNYKISLLQVRDSYGQFRIWAGNIGALQTLSSTSSLDYRLREVPKLLEQVIILLKDLKEALEDVCAIASGESENRVGTFVQADVERLSINDGIDGTGASTDDPSSPVSEPLSEIYEIFLSIPETITSLFKLSILIRNNSSRDRYAKALVTVSKAPFDDRFDIDYVGNKFPRLSRDDMAWLRVRLGKAITHRRQYLRYCREHHEKLSKAPAALNKSVASSEQKFETNFLEVQGQQSRSFIDDEMAISKPTSTLASTTASTMDPANLETADGLERLRDDIEADDRSQTSYATSIGEDDNDCRLSVVPLEEVAIPGQWFECPYCWTIQRFRRQNSWSKHVMRDLKPYVCTSETCDLKLFADRRTWFTHELQDHLVEWRCCFCSYPPQRSLPEFQDHVRKKHADMFVDGQLPALAQACQQPLDHLSPTACPLCDEWEAALRKSNPHISPTTSFVVTLQQFRRHLGRHMEQLALFAIPRGYKESGDAGSSGLASGCVSNASLVKASFDPLGANSRCLASASEDTDVIIWYLKSGFRRVLVGHGALVKAVVFSPDGQRLASASDDKTVRLWDTETMTLQQSFKSHTSQVWAVAFSPDGQWLASGCVDGTAGIWDAEKGILQKTLKCNNSYKPVRAIAFSLDGQQLVSASASILQIWDIETWALQQSIGGHTDQVSAIAFSPDGRWLASASFDRTVRLWDSETGSPKQVLYGHTDLVRAVIFSPDGCQLASASDDRTVRLWDAETGDQNTVLEHGDTMVNAVAFSANGQRLASGSDDFTVRVWDTEGNLVERLLGHTKRVWSVAFSPSVW